MFVIKLAILCFCVLFESCLIVNTSATDDCLERFIPKMNYYVSSWTLNSTYSLSTNHLTTVLLLTQVKTLQTSSDGACLFHSNFTNMSRVPPNVLKEVFQIRHRSVLDAVAHFWDRFAHRL